MRVLVVDDDPAALAGMSAVLGDDFEVTCAGSPQGAIELLGTQSFHVVCSDYQMPGMNGITLLARVLGLPIPPGALLVTGYAELREVKEKRERGEYSILAKPYDPSTLLSLVHQLASRVELQRRLQAMKPSRPPARRVS